ncbi:GTP-binding protein [Tahibacter harae]|uniref:ATP/GTP-binding protein n=1 Tax=Tahibacter harae TaxID=2963937 RepID=A0ABT1QQT1_9GAMM|nr:ATP/GTP-binding protein [Tahibacter harae]MCQ4164660.1 ATP/GTP-binding protein [Tahibacter harae]
MSEIKLLFAGPMGAGKTTAIRAISEIEPISTEVENTDFSESDKAETTVAMDYGELTLDSGDKLRLYGSPGQKRFEFMWPLLAQGALGVVVLLDNSRPEPLADLEDFLSAFSGLIEAGRVVVAVGRLETHPQPGLDDYLASVSRRGQFLPVIGADVRRRDDVVGMLELLFEQIESTASTAAAAVAAGAAGDDEWLQFVQRARAQ